jgi:hypothetical protein
MELVRVPRVLVSTFLSLVKPGAPGSPRAVIGQAAISRVHRSLESGPPIRGRAEILFGFLLTKNACRVRNRTWRLSRAKVRALASREANPTSQNEADKIAADVVVNAEPRC